MLSPEIFLAVIVVLAVVIVVGTIVAVLIVLRRSPTTAAAKPENPPANMDIINNLDEVTAPLDPGAEAQPSAVMHTPTADIEAYLTEKRANLAEFTLHDLSNTFKGTTRNSERKGVVVDINDSEKPLIAFSSQVFNAQNGSIAAETAYGKMELVITQGRGGVQWDGEPLGILDFARQRILGPERQLLGSMERPLAVPGSIPAENTYPIGFFGKKVADVNTRVNALSTLRWVGNDEVEPEPALQLEADIEDDQQTLLLVASILLEVGFFDIIE